MAPRRSLRARDTQLAFEALTIEGALLSPEWLAKVAQLQAANQTDADYRILKGLSLRDEIGRFWRVAQAHWAEFKIGRERQADPAQAAERFAAGLLREAFGFSSLATGAPVVLGDRTYPIRHHALEGRVPVVVAPAGSGLDTLSPDFGDDGRRRSAFGLVQEYINADERALWGLSTDGLTLRLCRDNASLTRPAWLEADLGRIFLEERYADFAALWLLLHESRFGAPGHPVTDCPLEAWRAAGREEGTRAREKLREGVEEALVALGRGFLSSSENQPLRAALHDGKLSRDAFFQQLLRLVYRIIFLLTAEERDVLHAKDASAEGKALYAEGYGLRRLRDRAAKRSAHDRFYDQWEVLRIVFRGVAKGEPRLGLPPLGGLFSADQCPDLDVARLENRWLLAAVFKLSWVRETAGLARVNWRDMGPEELGSVYESLLELVPIIPEDGRGFSFATGDATKGNARKTSGSYYTPDSLVQVLLDSALDPVIQATVAAHPEDPAEALLQLSVVDPACGSGHFLLAAARRIAVQLARFQAKGTPSAEQYRHAVRQVVGRCIFGVDLNPMAVELCRVSLWMEAVEPGRPLSFLDSHIQQGNALLGATPELMEKGIPDAAFEPIEGDDKKTASLLKKKNKAAAEGQRGFDALWSKPSDIEASAVVTAAKALDAAPDASLDDLVAKEAQWEGLQQSIAFTHQKFIADAWCAAFVWPKPPTEPKKVDPVVAAAPTNDLWRQIRDGQGRPPAETVKTVRELAGQYHFFHWHLAFPQVFARGGFDVVLGNPPWERVKLQEQEFFASRSPGIAGAKNAAARKKLIAALPEKDPALWKAWSEASREAEGQSQLIRCSARFPLCGRGDVNTYAVFAEHMAGLARGRGRAGFIAPTGLVTDDATSELFRAFTEQARFVSVLDFENTATEAFFPGVGNRRFKFCLATITGRGSPPVAATEFMFYADRIVHLQDPWRRFTLTAADLALVNPNSRTCPVFRSKRDAEIAKRIYGSFPVLVKKGDPGSNPWSIRFLTMFHMANDSGLFREASSLSNAGWRREGNRFVKGDGAMLPLYEAKMMHLFDHRYGDYDDQPEDSENTSLPDVPDSRLRDPAYEVQPRYWVDGAQVDEAVAGRWQSEWLLGWRDISNSGNERTCIITVLPLAACGHTLPSMLVGLEKSEVKKVACLQAALSSIAFDYVVRLKNGGTHLTFGIVEQLPVPAPRWFDSHAHHLSGTREAWILPRVLELTYTTDSLAPFASDMGIELRPFIWDATRRVILRAELDALFLHDYGLAREDAEYVLDTFKRLRLNEEGKFGEYRTKRVILDIYDAMAEAIRTGKPYQTRLDPPPADPRVAHPSRVPKRRATPARVEVLPDAVWERPQPYKPADTGVVIAAVLKTLGVPTPATRVRLAAILSLEPRLVTSPDARELTEWRRLVGPEASPLPKNVASFVPRADVGWAGAVKLLRGNGLLVEDLVAKTWAPGAGLDEVPTDGWAEGRVRWVVDLIARRGEALAQTLPAEIRRFVDEAAA